MLHGCSSYQSAALPLSYHTILEEEVFRDNQLLTSDIDGMCIRSVYDLDDDEKKIKIVF